MLLLRYYINLNLSITYCPYFRNIYLFFGISVSLSTVSKVFCIDFFLNFISNLLPIKSPVASAGF